MYFRRPAWLHCAVHTSWQHSLATPAWVCAPIAPLTELCDHTVFCKADRAFQRLLEARSRGSMLGQARLQRLSLLRRIDGCRCAAGGRHASFQYICAHAGVSLWQALFQLARTDKELVSTDYKIGSVVHRRKVNTHVLLVTYCCPSEIVQRLHINTCNAIEYRSAVHSARGCV